MGLDGRHAWNQYAIRETYSRPRIQLHSSHPLPPAVGRVPPLNRTQTVSTPAAALLFSRILDFEPEWPMRSDLSVFSWSPGFCAGCCRPGISLVNSTWIVKVGNCTVTRVSCRLNPFVSLRFARSRVTRIAIAADCAADYSRIRPQFQLLSIFQWISIGLSREPPLLWDARIFFRERRIIVQHSRGAFKGRYGLLRLSLTIWKFSISKIIRKNRGNPIYANFV